MTGGPDSALRQAKEAANGKDVRIGRGVSALRCYPVSPVLLGEDEPWFSGMNLAQLGFRPVRTVAGQNATHVLIERQ